MTRKTFWSVYIVAIIARIVMIARPPLWYDENFTLILARLPFERMIQATAGDVHPPLWYIIEWIYFHAFPALPVWAIRIPAALFSLASIVMFVKLCKVMRVPSRVTVGAAILMAILPMQIWYAQEGRMYAMLEFLVLAALYAGLTRQWTWFTFATVAMVYTQNYGLIYCAVIAIVLIVMDWSTVARVTIAAVVTVIAYMPWAFVTASQMTEITGRYWIMDSSAGAVIGAIYKQFWASAMLAQGTITSYVITFALLFIGIYAAASGRQWVVLAMAFAPLGLAWLASVLWQPLLLFRPLIGISPFLYLIACWPLASFRWDETTRPTALYAACFIVPMLMFGIAGYYINVSDMKGEGATSPLLGSLDYITANWQEGDVIYYADDGPMINLMPYTSLPQYKMPACDERIGYAPVLGSLSDSTRAAIGIQITDLDNIPHTRAWVFAPRSPLHPLCYETQIASIAPEGKQVITVDDNEFISSGIWLNTK
jgi:mannosyltransferase